MIKRLFLIAVIGFIIGIIEGLYFNFSVVLFYIPIIVIYFIIKKYFKFKRKFKLFSFHRYFRYCKLYITKKSLFLIVVASIISNTMVLMKNEKYNTLYSEKNLLNLVGIIISNKEEEQYYDKYTIKITENNKYNNTKLYLKVNKKIELKYGDKVSIKGEFIEPEESRNYGGFNYKQYLKTLKIYGTVKVENVQILEKDKANFIFILANKTKNRINEKIENLLPEEEASIFKGILLGEGKEIEEQIQENFRISNISHVLAVSGMHVGYIIIGINLIFQRSLGKRNTRYFIIIFLIIYMFLTNFTPSIVRSGVMGILVTLASLLHRKNDFFTAISISLLINLIENPFAIMSIGLQLSYLGTIGIILFHSKVFNLLKKIQIKNPKIKYRLYKFNNIAEKIKEIMAVTISAQIAILPVQLYHFNLIGTYFLITNLLVSVIIGPILILGIIVITLSFLIYPLSKILAVSLSIGIQILIGIAKIGELLFSKIYVPTPKMHIILIYFVILCVCYFIYSLYNSKKLTCTQRRFRNLIALFKYQIYINRKKYLIIFIFIILVLIIIQPNNLKIHFVDVGQGDCTFIVTPQNKTILIDGGGSNFSDFDVGKKTLLPYILDRGYNSIDYIFMSHFDSDHVLGILTVLEEIKVGQVVITKQIESSENYEQFLEIIKEKKIRITQVKRGDKLIIEKNLFFDVIWPIEEQITENPLNNNSMVAKLQYKDFSMLFTGDIEQIAEKEIMKNVSKEELKADVLKVAHHGSKTSSTNEFLNLVKPRIALIGVGQNNNFGHPNVEVIERLENLRD